MPGNSECTSGVHICGKVSGGGDCLFAVQVDAAAQQAIEQELIRAADEPLPDDGDDELLND